MSLPSMIPANIISRITARIAAVEKAVIELRAATGTLDGATIVDKITSARMSLRNGQLKIWPNYNADPDVFTVLSADSGASRMVRWFAPTAGGNVLANSFSMQGASASETGNMWLYTDGQLLLSANGRVVLDASGIDLLTGGGLRLYELPTTGSAANLRLDPATVNIQYVTSSLRYKADPADADIDVDDVLQMQGRTWVDKGTMERLAEAGEEADIPRNVGFIAEELDALPSLRQFVDYDEQGRPDAIQYDRLSVALLELAKSDHAELVDQRERLADQQQQIDALAARLDALEAT